MWYPQNLGFILQTGNSKSISSHVPNQSFQLRPGVEKGSWGVTVLHEKECEVEW